MRIRAHEERSEIRVALIGCGALTELFYSPALQRLATTDRLQVAALIDPVEARIDAIGRHFPDARRGRQLADVPEDVDLAVVASPAAYHAAQTIELLDRGFHVLCEKPMASNVAECKAMIEAARRAGRLLSVGHFKRFFPATQQVEQLCKTEALGRVRAFRFVEGGKFGWPAQSRAFFERKSSQGGVLSDIGAHALDLALWWLGQPTRIACEDDAMGGVEANCRVTLSYPDALTGEIVLTRDWNPINRYFIKFDKGWIGWDPIEGNRLELGFDGAFALDAHVHETVAAVGQPLLGRPALTRHQAFMDQLRNVANAVRGEEPLKVKAEDGLRVMALIQTCYETGSLIDMPWLTQAERERGKELRC